MSGAGSHDDEGMLLAGEYVLGVLSEHERRQVAARAAGDTVLATRITEWERLLAPLAYLVAPVEPPAELWPRLERSLGAAVIPIGSKMQRELRMWRNATAVALALAASMAVIAVLPRTVQPVSVAALAPLNGAAPAFVVRVLPGGGLNIASVAAANVPSGRDLELWALPAGAARPVSLGVLPAGGATVAASALTAPGGKLLVSLEPKGGSPTGQPTGPVLYGGTIIRL
jgi:anti-sigma-K factor RskA